MLQGWMHVCYQGETVRCGVCVACVAGAWSLCSSGALKRAWLVWQVRGGCVAVELVQAERCVSTNFVCSTYTYCPSHT